MPAEKEVIVNIQYLKLSTSQFYTHWISLNMKTLIVINWYFIPIMYFIYIWIITKGSYSVRMPSITTLKRFYTFPPTFIEVKIIKKNKFYEFKVTSVQLDVLIYTYIVKQSLHSTCSTYLLPKPWINLQTAFHLILLI